MSDLLQAVELCKSFPSGAEELRVLRGLELMVREGEFLTIVGASGTGKSTLLHLLALLDEPTGGRILLRGKNLSVLSARGRSAVRCRQFGFVFQFYYLLPEFNALENLVLPKMIELSRREYRGKREEIEGRGREIAGLLGVEGRLHHKPAQLSGGEQQRVAIGRALLNNPEVLFCDEPTGNLDERTSEEILNLIFKLNAELGTTVVMVTHNLDVAARSARTLELHEGRLHAWDRGRGLRS
ncbi:MAG: ABC transporter ATP-binding protein [Planctomycetota bacterium]